MTLFIHFHAYVCTFVNLFDILCVLNDYEKTYSSLKNTLYFISVKTTKCIKSHLSNEFNAEGGLWLLHRDIIISFKLIKI